MKVRPISSHQQADVTMPGAKLTKMRMLIGPAEGAPNFHMRHFEVAPGERGRHSARIIQVLKLPLHIGQIEGLTIGHAANGELILLYGERGSKTRAAVRSACARSLPLCETTSLSSACR